MGPTLHRSFSAQACVLLHDNALQATRRHLKRVPAPLVRYAHSARLSANYKDLSVGQSS